MIVVLVDMITIVHLLNKNKKAKEDARIAVLTAEIDKLTLALNDKGNAFV